MKERPIIFSGTMVQTILDGRKTMTRRVVKGYRVKPSPGGRPLLYHPDYDRRISPKCPYGTPGDRLWVRETWASVNTEEGPAIAYRADGAEGHSWKSPIHMHRWASRITLEVTGVRVERLHDISEEDARAEGIVDGGCLNCGNSEPCGCGDPEPDARDAFIWLWNSINGPGSWDANPWVWVIEFKRLKP